MRERGGCEEGEEKRGSKEKRDRARPGHGAHEATNSEAVYNRAVRT